MTKRVIVIMLVFLLSACGTEGTQSGTQNNDGKDQVEEKEEQKGENSPIPSWENESQEVVIYNMSGGTQDSFDDQYGKLIKERFPDYNIKFIPNADGTRIPEMLATSQTIDIMYNSFEYLPDPLFSNDLQFDMTDLIKEHQVDLSLFERELIAGIKHLGNGDIYMLPILDTTQIMYYNKEIFDKFGQDYPIDGMTWTETQELANRLTRIADGRHYLGFVAWPNHVLRTNQLSKPFLEEQTLKPTFFDEEWGQLLRTYHLNFAQQDIYKKRVSELKRLPNRVNFAKDQELAMFVFYSQLPFSVPDDFNAMDWDVVSQPVLEQLPTTGSQAAPSAFAITSISKSKHAAMEIIKYLTSTEVQTTWSRMGTMSVLQDDTIHSQFAQDSAFPDKNWGAVKYLDMAPLAYKSIYELQVQNILVGYIPDLIQGVLDINTALQRAYESAEKVLTEANSN